MLVMSPLSQPIRMASRVIAANSLQETAEEYTKSIDINGGKGFEHCDKTSNECAVVFFTGNRFLVTLEGDKIGAAALKQVTSVLKIK